MKTVEKPGVALNASTTDSTPLTQAEAEQLANCEQTIRKGLETYVEVGNALDKIQDQRLYRATHDTFEQYCRDKWGFTARQANRFISAAQVVENLKRDQLVSKVPVAIPKKESHARELTILPPEKQAEASRIVASKTSNPIGKDYKEAAQEVADEKPRVTVASKATTKTTTGKAMMETLIELIDEVETMVKHDKPKLAVLGKLKAVSDLAICSSPSISLVRITMIGGSIAVQTGNRQCSSIAIVQTSFLVTATSTTGATK